MKHTFLFIVAFFLSSTIFAQKNNYEIRGVLSNCKDTTASVTIWKGGETTNETLWVRDGKFVMEGICSEPMMVRVSFSNREIYKYVSSGGYIPYKCSSLWFLIYPGAKAVVQGKLTDFVDAYPEGDAENNKLASLTKMIFPIMNQCGNIQVKLENKNTSDQEKKKLTEEHNQLNDKMMRLQKEFVANNSSSYVAIWFLDDMMARKQLQPKEASLYFDRIKGENYTSTVWYGLIKNRIASTQYSVGNKLTGFKSRNSVDQTEFNLESLRGKYVILDFWGTWCGPCMSGMDHMRAFRDEHNGKVEIVGIAKDSRAGWLSVIKRDNLNWIHLLNGVGEEDFVSKFNITGYPTKLLISPDGEILHRESGESEDFYKTVKSLMKETSK